MEVIDYTQSDEEIAKQLKSLRSGFFILTKHPLTDHLISRIMSATRSLFALPYEAKEKISVTHNNLNRGYTPLGEEKLDPALKRGGTKEGYYISRDIHEGHPLARLPLHGPNVYPTEEQVPGFREVTAVYMEEVSKIGMRFVRIIGMVLEKSLEQYFELPMQFLRLLHYTPEESDADQGVMGCGEHTDFGMLTFLLTCGEPGLEVLVPTEGGGKEWTPVSVDSNALVVNFGDFLAILSEGRFPSTLHRVRTPSGAKDRYSIPFFFEGDPRARMVGNMTCLDYLLKRYTETSSYKPSQLSSN